MAVIVVDELITQLDYKANVKVIDQASKAVKALEADNLATAKATDLLTSEQTELADELAKTAEKAGRLRSQQQKLKTEIRRSGKATKSQKLRLLALENQLTNTSQRTRKLSNDSKALGIQKQRLSAQSRKLSQDQKRLARATRTATDRMKEQRVAAAELATTAKTAAVGALAAVAAGAVAVGEKVIETGASFESLRARLKTVEGSAEGASKAFSLIQDFAATTPFQLDNLAEAFVALRARGVEPTKDTLTALGDLSSAFGQEFGQVTDAIAAAARGELDPIEKFGISAKIAGDKISLSFKNQKVEIERSASAVTDALVAFGKMSGVQGAMAAQSATTTGKLSNLQDTLSQFFDKVAQLGVLEEFNKILARLSESLGGDGGLAQILADLLVGALSAVRGAIEAVPGEQLTELFGALIELVGLLVGELVSSAEGGTSTVAMLLELVSALIQAAAAVVDMFQRVQAFREESDRLPGILDPVIAAFKLMVKGITALIDLFTRLVNALDPVLEKMRSLASLLPEFNLFDRAGSKLESFASKLGLVNTELSGTAREATSAFEAIRKLVQAQEDLTDQELQKKRLKGGKEGEEAEAEIRRRVKEREDAEKREERAARKKAKADEKTGRAAEVAKRFDKLTDAQLAAFITDPTVTPKLRAKAEKEQIRRDKKKTKAGAKAGKTQRESLLTASITKEIEKAAKAAGQRAAARATLRGGLSPEQINKIELERRKEVETRLTTRFRETGELPPGLAAGLVQTANLPNIEQVGGRVAPPVITVNNMRIEVRDNVFEANVSVAGTSATASEIANAAIGQARPVLMGDLGRAVQNMVTQERR